MKSVEKIKILCSPLSRASFLTRDKKNLLCRKEKKKLKKNIKQQDGVHHAAAAIAAHGLERRECDRVESVQFQCRGLNRGELEGSGSGHAACRLGQYLPERLRILPTSPIVRFF